MENPSRWPAAPWRSPRPASWRCSPRLLERRGAAVLRCPLVAIRDAPDPAPVLAFARALAGGAFDDLILTTGEGLRRILACIERHEPPLRAAFLAALAAGAQDHPRAQAGARAARAGTEVRPRRRAADHRRHHRDPQAPSPSQAGASACSSTAPSPTAADRVSSPARGRRGAAPWRPTCTRTPRTMRRCTASSARMRRRRGGCDRLHQHPAGRAPVRARPCRRAWARRCAHTLVAAVGPVVAATLRRHGIEARLMPADAFFLKPLTTRSGRGAARAAPEERACLPAMGPVATRPATLSGHALQHTAGEKRDDH